MWETLMEAYWAYKVGSVIACTWIGVGITASLLVIVLTIIAMVEWFESSIIVAPWSKDKDEVARCWFDFPKIRVILSALLIAATLVGVGYAMKVERAWFEKTAIATAKIIDKNPELQPELLINTTANSAANIIKAIEKASKTFEIK